MQKRQEPPCGSQGGSWDEELSDLRGSADRKTGSSHRDIQYRGSKKNVDDGKCHMMRKFGGLTEELRPVTGLFSARCIDPDTRCHQLESEDHEGRHESNDGENVGKTLAAAFVLIFIIDRRSLRRL